MLYKFNHIVKYRVEIILQLCIFTRMDISKISDINSVREHRSTIKNRIHDDVKLLQTILPDVPEVSRLFGAILEGEILLSNLNLLEQSKAVGDIPPEKFSALMYAMKREIQTLEFVSKLVLRPTSPVVSSQSAVNGVF